MTGAENHLGRQIVGRADAIATPRATARRGTGTRTANATAANVNSVVAEDAVRRETEIGQLQMTLQGENNH